MPHSTTPLYTKRTSSFHGPERTATVCTTAVSPVKTAEAQTVSPHSSISLSSRSAPKALTQGSSGDDCNTAAKSDCSTHTRCGTYVRRALRSSTARLDAPSSRKTSKSDAAPSVSRKFPRSILCTRTNTALIFLAEAAVNCGHVPAPVNRTLKTRDPASACLVDLTMPWFPNSVRARGMYSAVAALARLVASRCIEDDFAETIPKCL